MDKVKKIFENIDSISRVILSKPIGDIVKASVRRVKLSTGIVWQVEYFENNQAKHKNFELNKICDFVMQNFPKLFHQMNVMTTEGEYTALCSKKGSINVTKNSKNKMDIEIESHNKQKN